MLKYPFSPNLSTDSIQSQTNSAKFYEKNQADPNIFLKTLMIKKSRNKFDSLEDLHYPMSATINYDSYKDCLTTRIDRWINKTEYRVEALTYTINF